MKNYNDLKNSKYGLVIYVDSDKHIKTNYFVNLKHEDIKRLITNKGYKVLHIQSISFEEYVNNNLSFNNFEQIDDVNLFNVEFWQKDILQLTELSIENIYNTSFVTYQLTASEIKHIYKLQTYHDNGICEYFTYYEWVKIQKYF